MKKYTTRLTIELILKLLQGIKLEQILEGEFRLTILPPQEGRFITYKELDEIIADRTNIVERLLKLMEKTQ